MRTRILLMGLLLAAVANARLSIMMLLPSPFWAKQQNLPLPAMSVCRTLCRTSPANHCGLRPQQCRTRRAPLFQLYKHFRQMGSKEQYEYEPHDTDRH